jgi:hypothetical protein
MCGRFTLIINLSTIKKPLALHLDDFPGNGIDDATDDRHQLSPAIDLDLGDSITSFLAGEGDSLDLTLKIREIIGRH